jgi:hypothetical protein
MERTEARPKRNKEPDDGSGIMVILPTPVPVLNENAEPMVVPPKAAKAVLEVKPNVMVLVSKEVAAGMIQLVSARMKTGVDEVAPR